MKPELNPCSCGGKAELCGTPGYLIVRCNKCEEKSTFYSHRQRNLVIKEWNKKHSPEFSDAATEKNLTVEDCDRCEWCGQYYDPDSEGHAHHQGCECDMCTQGTEIRGKEFCCQECECQWLMVN